VASEVGAVAVVDREGKLRGIFTEHDAVYRVLAGHLDLDTRIRAVMTDPVARVPVDTRRRDVLTILVKSRYRHLPVCDDDGTVRGMVSASSVLRREVERLRTQLDSLESFLTADGPGG
jgi:CBS domain-containing protein